MSFGNKIRLLREDRRINAKAMADHLDIDLATLNRIENDKIKTIKPQLLVKISEYLKVGIGELFETEITLAPPPPVSIHDGEHTIAIMDVLRLYEQLLKSKDLIIEVLQRENEYLRKKVS